MKPRNLIPQKEREARSKLAKLVHRQLFIKGSIVVMKNSCGKPNCKCTKGEKHFSSCLAIRQEGKRKMIHIPKRWENQVQKGINTYKEVMKLMDIVSDCFVKGLIRAKESKKIG